ncbi:hypothetical protein AXF42_Ash004000 [Apostasia shenzhenica]|uniref:Zeta toxin domain-containing protein n=1 Tax=Apostasia shenzhenica TaxID=1088818 RepID=A0A2I0AIK0_9ASPA|nr:hypothetical protein AXF42_Ash004000 [Apostasia shenzhenica]
MPRNNLLNYRSSLSGHEIARSSRRPPQRWLPGNGFEHKDRRIAERWRNGISNAPGGHRPFSISVAADAAIAATAFLCHGQEQLQQLRGNAQPIPFLTMADSGRVDDLEHFPQYVARQIGFGDISECPQLGKLAYDYVRKTHGFEDNIFAAFSSEPDAEALSEKLMDELDRCILGYFAYHWKHAALMISQILDADIKPAGKLKSMVMEATRKQRFERVSRNLKVTRVFSTLLDEMKAIGIGGSFQEDVGYKEVMIPAAHVDRSPVLLLMGGGMGAGKSTVLQNKLLKEAFWSEAATNAVVVEADAFKETDVIFRAMSSRGYHNDIIQTAELVHQSSMDAASSLLVTALNEGRDVIMDGTLSWEPFVEQTIAMARAVHCHRYRMGPGYKIADDDSIIENYWEPIEEDDEEEGNRKNLSSDQNRELCRCRKPYRIELVGVICDAYLAVVRGIRRAILMGRAVRVKSQLMSHKRFATAFPKYCQLVDNARLYCTNTIGSPMLIGWKDGESRLLVDPSEIAWLEKVSGLNVDADNVHEVYSTEGPPPALLFRSPEPTSVWEDAVLCASRVANQLALKQALHLTSSFPH